MAAKTHRNHTNHGPAMVRMLLLALALAGASLVTLHVPAAGAQPTCALPPVTVPLFRATPAATVALPATPVAELTGRPLTEAEQAEITQAVRAIVVCLNSGVPKDVWAVFTPRYLAALFTGPHPAYQPAFEQMIGEDRINPAQSHPDFVLKKVRDGLLLEDGRIAVTIDLQGPDETWHDRLVLAKVGKHWLIDAVAEFNPPLPTPPAG